MTPTRPTPAAPLRARLASARFGALGGARAARPVRRALAGLLLGLGLGALTLAGCDAESDVTTVGPRGGTVESADGVVTLTVPAGALASEQPLVLLETDAPAGMMATAYALEPAGLVFAIPATVTFELDAAAEPQLQAADLEPLVARGEVWVPLADRRADAAANTLSASVRYASELGLSRGAWATAPGEDAEQP